MAQGTHVPVAHDSLLHRITIDPGVRFGKPCIRGHRITVHYPQLELDDFLAIYAYAAELAAGRKASGG
jgi:uncharacterized protein (DUF433 family)